MKVVADSFQLDPDDLLNDESDIPEEVSKNMSEKIREQIMQDKELAATVERVVVHADSTKGRRLTLDRTPELTERKLIRNKRQLTRIQKDRARKVAKASAKRAKHKRRSQGRIRRKATKKKKK